MGAVLSTALSLMIVVSAVPGHLKEAVYAGAAANVSVNGLVFITNGFQLAFMITTMITLSAAFAAFYTKVPTAKAKSIKVQQKRDVA